MLDIIEYDNIEKKNEIESTSTTPLDSHESLIQTLNMIDFMSVLRPKHEFRTIDTTLWIVLESK